MDQSFLGVSLRTRVTWGVSLTDHELLGVSRRNRISWGVSLRTIITRAFAVLGRFSTDQSYMGVCLCAIVTGAFAYGPELLGSLPMDQSYLGVCLWTRVTWAFVH